MVIRPTLDNVLVKVDVVEAASPGGILLVNADTAVKNTGFVVAVGDSEVIKVAPGDHVLFEKGMGRRFEVPEKREVGGMFFTDQVKYVLVAYYDIVAVLEEG